MDPDIDPSTTRISPSDAAAMLRKRIPPNCPPYQAEVIRSNNRLVDQWKTEVLDKLAVGGTVDATTVADSWATFYEGHMIPNYVALHEQGLIMTPKVESVDYWKTYLAKATVEELVQAGKSNVEEAWRDCIMYSRYWYSVQKYNRVYKNHTPLEWEKLRRENITLFKGREYILWEPEVQEDIFAKVRAVVSISIEPEGLPGR